MVTLKLVRYIVLTPRAYRWRRLIRRYLAYISPIYRTCQWCMRVLEASDLQPVRHNCTECFILTVQNVTAVSYTHLRAHETREDLVCRLLLEKKKEREKRITQSRKQGTKTSKKIVLKASP